VADADAAARAAHETAATDLIAQRVSRPYFVEAVRMLQAGRGSVADIDGALESAGYTRGPLRAIDDAGLDVDLAIGEALLETWGEERFASPELQRDLVAAGSLGRAAGRGFYRYGADGQAVVAVSRPLTARLTPERIVERLELAVINEAYRTVADGLGAPPVIDKAMRTAAAFPLGPFEMVDRLGLRTVIARLRALEQESDQSSGDQYLVAALLWQMATV
jgi:3-hydroxyacyl-CoA dehydrogenase